MSGDELWLLGSDIAQSPSPAMHNAALAALGLPPRYRLRPCAPEELDRVLDEAERVCRGINVTLPHKVRVAERYRAALDDTAARTGAVNTVVYEGGRARAALNTDVHGLLVAWRRGAIPVEDRRVVIVGAGGAARAAVVALADARARSVSIRARRPEQAEALRALAAREGLEADTGEGPPGDMLLLAVPQVDAPDDVIGAALQAPGVVHDLRYGPRTTALRDASLRAGHLFVDGTSMLLGQGVRALEAFLGRPPGRDAEAAMARALAAHLRSGAGR